MGRKVAAALAAAGIAGYAALAGAAISPGSGINGSFHDLNAISGYKGDQISRTCVFCHTPHNARKVDLVPLWNHAETTLSVLSPYTWTAPANKEIEFASDPLVGPSRLCMACHDGSTAVDSHGSASSSPGTTAMTASYNDGLGNVAKRYITELKVTHPIGIKYDLAFEKRGVLELVPSTHGYLVNTVEGRTWNTHNRTGLRESDRKIRDTLYGGYLTCASCHDVHNSVNVSPGGTGSYNYFLHAREEGSALCLSCHVK